MLHFCSMEGIHIILRVTWPYFIFTRGLYFQTNVVTRGGSLTEVHTLQRVLVLEKF